MKQNANCFESALNYAVDIWCLFFKKKKKKRRVVWNKYFGIQIHFLLAVPRFIFQFKRRFEDDPIIRSEKSITQLALLMKYDFNISFWNVYRPTYSAEGICLILSLLSNEYWRLKWKRLKWWCDLLLLFLNRSQSMEYMGFSYNCFVGSAQLK